MLLECKRMLKELKKLKGLAPLSKVTRTLQLVTGSIMSKQEIFRAVEARIQAEFNAHRARVTRTHDMQFIEFFNDAGERIATSFVQDSDDKVQWMEYVDKDHVRLRLLIVPNLPVHQGADLGPYYNSDGWEWNEFVIVVHRDLIEKGIDKEESDLEYEKSKIPAASLLPKYSPFNEGMITAYAVCNLKYPMYSDEWYDELEKQEVFHQFRAWCYNMSGGRMTTGW